jgi:pilus assembly protein CpaE
VRKLEKSNAAATVMFVGLESAEIGQVREILAAEAVLPSGSVGFGDAMIVVKRMRPHVVIVGFKESVDAAISLGQALTREEPKITLIALADESDATTILSSMRVGYKEFVVLPEDSEQLRSVVHEAAYGDSEEIDGLVIAMIGAKGGVGTTVLTTHLAAEFAAIHRVLAIDLDFNAGDMTTMLDINPNDSIVDLLPRADRIDERMLTGAIGVHRSKAHVLGQPSEGAAHAEVNGDDIYAVLLTAASVYQYVMIDCGSYLDDAVITALHVADTIILITTPDVIAVRDAHKKLAALEYHGIDRERVKIVINRMHRNAYVLEEDIEKNLGVAPAGTVAEDSKLINQAINDGKLVRELNRRAECARDISSLVSLLTDGADDFDDDFEDEQAPSSLISRLFGRP